MIEVADVRVTLSASENVNRVLAHGQLSRGVFVPELEKRVAELAGCDFGVAVSSGTTALSLLLSAVGATKVVIPAFTYAGTAHAAMAAGCDIRFADIGDDWLIRCEPDDDETVIPVHLFGQHAGLFPSMVEDGAQAIGQTMWTGIVSLHGSKSGGCGEGGVVVTNDPEIAERVRLWSNQGGMVERYNHVTFGVNARLSNVHAAIALGQLENIESVLATRRRNAGVLWSMLCDGDPPESSWHQFTIEVSDRVRFRSELADQGIGTTVHYPYALPDLPYMPDGDTPRARLAADRIVSLPVHEHLTVGEVERVGEAARAAR